MRTLREAQFINREAWSRGFERLLDQSGDMKKIQILSPDEAKKIETLLNELEGE